jgi:WD40 repeat protein
LPRPPRPRLLNLPSKGTLLTLLLFIALGAAGYYVRDEIAEFEVGDVTEFLEEVELPAIKAPKQLFPEQDPSRLLKTIKAHGDGATYLRAMGEKDAVLSAGRTSGIRLWLMPAGQEIDITGLSGDTIEALDVRDGLLLTGYADGTISLYDLRAKGLIGSFEAMPGGVKSVAFAGREYDFIVGGAAGEMLYYQQHQDGYTPLDFRRKAHLGDISAIAANKNFIVTGATDKTGKFWRRSRRSLVRTYRGHKGTINALDISADGRRVASASDDGTVRIWSNRSRRVRRILKGHKGPVYAVAYSPNNKWVASGGEDRLVKLWDVRRGRSIYSFEGHRGAVRGLVFTQDGNHLISASDDGTIRIWDLQDRPKTAAQ